MCGARLPEPVFVLEEAPAGAQILLDKSELGQDRGISLPVCVCEDCGLVQLDVEPVGYYREAIRVVGLSGTMKELRRADYRHLINEYGLAGKKWIECGCGNGDFLKVLEEFDADIYGIEAGHANVLEARAGLRRTDKEHIMEMFADKEYNLIPGGPFDCFLSFNFLEHQPDPMAMLNCMRNNLVPGGIGLISVPSFEYILENGRYYELIRDHIANYDRSSLSELIRRCGFELLELKTIGIGDTIEAVIRKPIDERASVYDKDLERGSDIKTGLSHFKKDYNSIRDEIAAYMDELKQDGRSIAIWGAGHQGLTIAATTKLADNIRYIIDSSERKQGLYAPVSHVPIVSPEHYFEDPVDVIMITAPGYAAEIEKGIRIRYADSLKEKGLPKVCDILNITER